MAEPSRALPRDGRTLTQSITIDLLEEIRSGRLRVGDRIPTERGLMGRYGVGRNTVREAVQALVAMGALEVRPGRGGVVTAVPAENALPASTIGALLEDQAITDLYEFRLLLETEAAALAATRATPEQLAAIRTALAEYHVALQVGAPSITADLALHRAIAEASQNAIFPKVLDATSDLLLHARQATEAVPEAVARAAVEHQLIVGAIENGDAEAARAAMDTHIRSAIWALEAARRLARDEQKLEES